MRLQGRVKNLEDRLNQLQLQQPPEMTSLAMDEETKREVISILLDLGLVSQEEASQGEAARGR